MRNNTVAINPTSNESQYGNMLKITPTTLGGGVLVSLELKLGIAHQIAKRGCPRIHRHY